MLYPRLTDDLVYDVELSMFCHSRHVFFFTIVLFFQFLITRTLCWETKSPTIMNDLQIMQNKAARIISDRPFYSSATDALTTLKWLNLGQRRHYHRCLYIFKCVNKLSCHSMDLDTRKNKLGQTEAVIPCSKA